MTEKHPLGHQREDNEYPHLRPPPANRDRQGKQNARHRREHASVDRSVQPYLELDLDEQESVMLALKSNERTPASTGRGLVVQREFRLESRTGDGVTNEKILSKVRHHLPISGAAARVRF